MKVGLVGWGAMGRPMADRLVAAGHEVTVLVRRPEARSDAEAAGLRWAGTIGDTVADAEVVLCVVLTDDQVRSAGADAVGSMAGGAVLVQHTTCDPATVELLAEAGRSRGVRVLDAALSGGPPHIATGDLTLWVGGDEAVLDRVRPLLGVYASPVLAVGPVGDGQRIKLVNNALRVANGGLVVDAIRLAGSLGISERTFLDAVQHGSGASRALGALVTAGSLEALARVSGPLMQKDLQTVREVADRAGADLGLLGAVLGSDAVRRAITP